MRTTTHEEASWPELDWAEWKDTADTLHMWMQMVGKTRTALAPLQNHWWNVPLYVTARGLSTSVMPVGLGGLLDIEFDFVAHRLVFRRESGQEALIELRPRSVAEFFDIYRATLAVLGVLLDIDPRPVEVPKPIRFDQDHVHAQYDPDAVARFWRILGRVDTLLKQFSTNYYGKISPVHFFWGSMDLAVTRFSGRRAPERQGADRIQAEGYSHEVISAGFWPGNGSYGQAAFYAYAAPIPDGLSNVVLAGPGAFNKELGEFILNYDDVRSAADPDQTVLDFLQQTYRAAANLAGWDSTRLDRLDYIGQAAVRLPRQSMREGIGGTGEAIS